MMDIGEVGKNNNSHRSSGEAQGTSTPSSEFVLQWGNRKRLRCMKIHSASHRTKLRIKSGNTNITTFRRPSSPPPPPFSRNFESMKGQSSNGGVKEEKVNLTTTNNNNNGNGVGGASGSSETSKKGGSSSGSEAIPVWLPKFVIALTNKEKEEDFMAIKGSKLPQRPKKRAKFLQRTLNLVSPGAWLCDLTLDRYEVREKKISNKRPRGLKAMGNIDTDSD